MGARERKVRDKSEENNVRDDRIVKSLEPKIWRRFRTPRMIGHSFFHINHDLKFRMYNKL